MPIQLLSERVIAQIAAGEVVERPASVVKELIENALDAGARSVAVEAEGGGRRLIRVADDGAGIPAAEVELAFARHATSKLQSADDLAQITSLGFRGEALAAISAVSQVTLVTRAHDETTGTRIRVHGGAIIDRGAVGAPAGTVVTVEHLFYTTPARLKFLKQESTERRHIDGMVTRYAMAYPAVRFSLAQDGREAFRASGSGRLEDVLVAVMGVDDFRQMLRVDAPPRADRPDLPPVQVSGFVSAPALNRANRSHTTLFVNGRPIQDTSLTYAVTQAYHTLLMKGRHPVAVLMIEVPPDMVDVNVHPMKAEVRFRHPDAVFSAVQRAVRAAVLDQTPVAPVRPGAFGSTPGVWTTESPRRTTPAGEQPRMDLVLSEPGQRSDPSAAAPTRTLPVLRVVGQVGASYIVAEGPAGLYLIDQHAAHERILYEQFMAERAAHGAVSQQTLEGVVIDLDRRSAALVAEHLDALASIGFVLEPFGGTTYRVRAVPDILADQDPAEALRVIIADLEAEARPGQATVEERMAARACKTAAIKAGQVLSSAEMQALVRQLEHCANPRTCPHGRPTMIHMTAEQLSKEFGRE